MDIKPSTINKLKNEIVKELKKYDQGEFATYIGKRRKFPKVFTAGNIPIDNVNLVHELYKTAYMTSVEEAIRRLVVAAPKKAEIPVYEIVKVYDELENFMFGSTHEGVYRGLLRKISIEGYSSEADIPDIIQAVERLFIDGYKVVKRGNKYIVVTPDFNQYMELKSLEREVVKDDFYIESARKLISLAPSNIKTKVTFLLTPPTEQEKEVFQPFSILSSTAVTLSDFLKRHGNLSVVDAKVYENHSTVTLKESRKRITLFSYRGKEYSNYWQTVVEAIENSILGFFVEEQGFMFVRPFPHVYILGLDGYIITKAYLINNRLAEDVVDYFPLDFSVLPKTRFGSLNDEYTKQLLRELADYALVKMALGKDSLSPIEQKIEPATVTVYNFQHGPNKILEEYRYKVTGKVSRKNGANLILGISDAISAARGIVESGQLSPQFIKYFGGQIGITHDAFKLKSGDSIKITDIPASLFRLSPSWKLNGRGLISGDIDPYDDPITRMVSASGLPQYDLVTMYIKNRIMLLSLLAEML